jgi:hypothetical protein
LLLDSTSLTKLALESTGSTKRQADQAGNIVKQNVKNKAIIFLVITITSVLFERK